MTCNFSSWTSLEFKKHKHHNLFKWNVIIRRMECEFLSHQHETSLVWGCTFQKNMSLIKDINTVPITSHYNYNSRKTNKQTNLSTLLADYYNTSSAPIQVSHAILLPNGMPCGRDIRLILPRTCRAIVWILLGGQDFYWLILHIELQYERALQNGRRLEMENLNSKWKQKLALPALLWILSNKVKCFHIYKGLIGIVNKDSWLKWH